MRAYVHALNAAGHFMPLSDPGGIGATTSGFAYRYSCNLATASTSFGMAIV